MKPTRRWTEIWKGAVLAGALSVAAFSGANAETITASPSGAGLSNAPDFSFNGIRTSDFSSNQPHLDRGGASPSRSPGSYRSPTSDEFGLGRPPLVPFARAAAALAGDVAWVACRLMPVTKRSHEIGRRPTRKDLSTAPQRAR